LNSTLVQCPTVCLCHSSPDDMIVENLPGPCQFPTLGFVVARWKDVKDFRPEPFWYIYLSIAHDGAETKFTWKRGHLFDHNEAANLYERVMSNVTAHVTNTENKETKKW